MTPEAAIASLAATLRQDAGDLFGLREERKLLVAPELADALRTLLAARLVPEAWVPGRERTRIHSLYFDTADFALYRGCMDPLAANLKFRLRAYADARTPESPDPGCFLEAKLGAPADEGPRLKRKSRIALSRAQLEALLARAGGAQDVLLAGKKRFWRPALAVMSELSLAPRLTVSYEREAYVDPAGRLRVTLDCGYHAAVVQGAASAWPLAPTAWPERVIIEIKSVGGVPTWLVEALVASGLVPEGQSFSKFKTAVPALFPAEFPWVSA